MHQSSNISKLKWNVLNQYTVNQQTLKDIQHQNSRLVTLSNSTIKILQPIDLVQNSIPNVSDLSQLPKSSPPMLTNWFPPSMKIHQVQHVLLLDPAATNPLNGQRNAPPPSIEIDGELKWLVEDILDSKMFRNKLRYLVKWMGYNKPNWEPAVNVNKLQAVDQFHSQYSSKLGPLPNNDD